MLLVLALIVTLLTGTLTGWLGHWALHQRWAGRFFRAHLTHHKLYPPSSLTSDTYREPRGDNTTFFLGPAVGFVALTWLGLLIWFEAGWLVYLAVVVLGAIVGYLHEYMHEAFHTSGHWLSRFGWFRHLQAKHFIHHAKAGSNLGILWFGWDRLFGTRK